MNETLLIEIKRMFAIAQNNSHNCFCDDVSEIAGTCIVFIARYLNITCLSLQEGCFLELCNSQ